MTISSTTNRVSYAGDGSTTVFSYPHRFLEDDDLLVIVVDDSTGAETEQTLSTDYTVSGAGDDNGGSITFTSAPASGKTVVILNDPDITQGYDPEDGSALAANSLETAFDRLTLINQRQSDQIGRAFRKSDGDTSGAATVLPVPVENRSFKYVSDGSGGLELGLTSHDPDEAQEDAEAAKTAAEAAQTAAETAQSGAETAETGAQTARTGAETAESSAEAWAEGTEPGGAGTKSAKDWAATARMTGVVEMWPFSNEPSGWVFVDGRTIGDTGSGADHEGPEFEPLFDMLKAEGAIWGNTGSEDFAAGDTVKLPDGRDRSPVGDNSMGSTDAGRIGNTSTGLGDVGGEDAHTLTTGEMPSHDHGGGNHNHTQRSDGTDVGSLDRPQLNSAASGGGALTNSGTTLNSGTTINSEGGDSPHNNMHPFFAVNYIMKV